MVFQLGHGGLPLQFANGGKDHEVAGTWSGNNEAVRSNAGSRVE